MKKNEQERKYSELTIFEWEALQKYIKENAKEKCQHYYSVRVGGITELEGIKEEWLKTLIKHNTKLKIDCVEIDANNEIKIIEVKQVADTGALGQLLSYQFLYQLENNIMPKMLLLCLYANETILGLCEYFKIKVIQQ